MAHAVLSPSGASRWTVCTRSARLEQGFPDRAGEDAKKGTVAHVLAENLIKRELKLITEIRYLLVLSEIQSIVDANGNPYYDTEMLAYCEDYRDYVIEVYNRARAKTPDTIILLEQSLDLQAYIPEGFGTADVIIIADGTLYFIDLKYGKGVEVSAIENAQMKVYSLGALVKYDLVYSIDNVHMTIYQPRINNISEWEISAEALYDWGATFLRPQALLAFAGEGDFVPGEKQCKFCRAKPMCKALADYNMELAGEVFKDITLLSDMEVADILSRAKLFTDWITSLKDYALEQAVTNGKKWPGFKVVEGRSNRKYIDAKVVIERLKENGFDETVIFKPQELLGITALQGAIGKPVFASTVEPLLIKPQGKPTLVLLDDKRPEMSSFEDAASVFADVEIED